MNRLVPAGLGAVLVLAGLAPAAWPQTPDLPRLAEPAPPFLGEAPVVEGDDALDCRGLQRRINELADQPQRRYWLEQRYDADCRRGQASRNPAAPGGSP
ncbi:MAG: hypothetical protein MUF66_04605 [Gammaproteobacteria bacterium]|jgi:hypothetical protein|nr:hypothetical protein [Gammaproteobacteria bacterium]